MIRVALAGAFGRMGRDVLESAAADSTVKIVAALVTRRDREQESTTTTITMGEGVIPVSTELTADCDVIVEFAGADGSMEWLNVCRTRRIPLVMGSTGHDEGNLSRVRDAASVIPIVKASNFSVGVQTLLRLSEEIRRALGCDYDVEIVETHHRDKIDAPSGTALGIADAIRSADTKSGQRIAVNLIRGRDGRTGPRPRGAIGVHAVRMGEIVGQHEIHFSGPGETLTVRHAASSRAPFARGALRAARWVVGRRPGLYSMRDVLLDETGEQAAGGHP